MHAMIYRSAQRKQNFLTVTSPACGTDLDFCCLKHWLPASIANDSNFLPKDNKSIINKNFSVWWKNDGCGWYVTGVLRWLDITGLRECTPALNFPVILVNYSCVWLPGLILGIYEPGPRNIFMLFTFVPCILLLSKYFITNWCTRELFKKDY